MSQRKPAAKKSKSERPSLSGRRKVWLAWMLRLSLVGLALLAGWLVYLDAQVRERFDGNKWALPAKVYARPLLLYPGQLLSASQLEAELSWSDYSARGYADRPGSYTRSGEQWTIFRRAFPFWDGPESARRIELSIRDGRISRLREQGEDVGLVRLEPQYIGGIFPAHNEDRELVRLEDVPPALVAALVVTEDKAFFEHWGISLRGIARAMLANVKAGGFVQGGSTLTQQLVKNFFLSSERTLIRKGQEALMALLLELHYSKEEILQAYLNEVYLGQAGRRAIHGFGLAARFYFGKSVKELDNGEIATLVGLVKGASYYNPRRNPERAKERRDLILGLMADNGIITDGQRIVAQGKPLLTSAAGRAGQREYPAFLELARAQLQRDYRLQDLQSEGLRIFTTLDPWMQNAVEEAAQATLKRLESRSRELKDVLETAAVITSVDGGEVRALLGSRKPEFFGFNRALAAKRAIGSLAKPVVYLAALESGRYHWGSVIDDKPVSVSGPGGQLWQPQNYDHKSHGALPMADALARSLNQATARLGMTVGLGNVAATFKELGLQAEVPPYPSMLLGAISLSPVEVAAMYQTIASQGFVMPLRTIEAVATAKGETLSSYALRGEQVVSPAMMQWLRYGLEQVAERGTARRITQELEGPLAAKTGTSDDQRDAWFAGFDNRHLGVVWVGRDDNQPMPFAGSSAALPIWLDTFRSAGSEPLPPADLLQMVPVNAAGQLVENGCRGTLYPFIRDRVPAAAGQCDPLTEPSSGEKKSWFDWLF
ncbi:penicillin-binding protein 1B [Thalassolituus marinus]|uniref:Penicillin-binding protein 1B n=1 Tax=Thalassolituus marinus TaxID=671053 RepID=A0ABS7ZP48_9GAMM|nr:penicillin-binding protein 1B [Thalassolituus marinus]MCA6063491.1 penicillin-binding protein 1B [Thalassolituus marinus]